MADIGEIDVDLDPAGYLQGVNQLDQAKEYYQKLLSEFTDSPLRQDADQSLRRLGVTPAAAAANPS